MNKNKKDGKKLTIEIQDKETNRGIPIEGIITSLK